MFRNNHKVRWLSIPETIHFFDLLGRFTIQNVVPQSDGDSSKVKVKVRVNVHGIFSVSSASLIEKQKGEVEDVQMEMEPTVQNESRQEDQVDNIKHLSSHLNQKSKTERR